MGFYAGASYQLWKRIYDKRIITDEGVFAEDQVPDDYAGPELQIEYSQIEVFVNSAGRFLEFRMFDLEQVMDKDRKKGPGMKYTVGTTQKQVDPVGDSSHVMETYLRDIKTTLSETVLAKANALYSKYIADRTEEEG